MYNILRWGKKSFVWRWNRICICITWKAFYF